jgi:hypothetical protein
MIPSRWWTATLTKNRVPQDSTADFEVSQPVQICGARVYGAASPGDWPKGGQVRLQLFLFADMRLGSTEWVAYSPSATDARTVSLSFKQPIRLQQWVSYNLHVEYNNVPKHKRLYGTKEVKRIVKRIRAEFLGTASAREFVYARSRDNTALRNIVEIHFLPLPP